MIKVSANEGVAAAGVQGAGGGYYNRGGPADHCVAIYIHDEHSVAFDAGIGPK